jgi:hypothetical protein
MLESSPAWRPAPDRASRQGWQPEEDEEELHQEWRIANEFDIDPIARLSSIGPLWAAAPRMLRNVPVSGDSDQQIVVAAPRAIAPVASASQRSLGCSP